MRRLASALALCCVFAACGDDENSDPADTGVADAVGADSGTVDSGVSDATADGSDAAGDASGAFTGTISGNIFWNNGEVPSGTLLVALSSTSPPSEPFIAERIDDPAAPPTTFSFDGIEEGNVWVFAFFDVDPPSSWDAPGDEDFVALSESPVGVRPETPTMENINVELR